MKVKVKPLEWKEVIPNFYRAEGVAGHRYEISTPPKRNGNCHVYYITPCGEMVWDTEINNLIVAKEECQEDYESVIMEIINDLVEITER